MLFKKSNSDRKKLQKLIGFLNAKRFWLCAGNCIVAPECFYCQLTYQLNYSYKKNRKAALLLFENSIFSNAFNRFQELHERHKEKRKWTNYSKSFNKVARTSFLIIDY